MNIRTGMRTCMRGLAWLVSIGVASGCGGLGMAPPAAPSGTSQASCVNGSVACTNGGSGELVVPALALVGAATLSLVVYKVLEHTRDANANANADADGDQAASPARTAERRSASGAQPGSG